MMVAVKERTVAKERTDMKERTVTKEKNVGKVKIAEKNGEKKERSVAGTEKNAAEMMIVAVTMEDQTETMAILEDVL